MYKNFLLLILSLTIIACDSLGPRRIKNIRELTPSLSVNSNEKIAVNTTLTSPFTTSAHTKFYTINKARIISTPVFAKGVLYSVDHRGNVAAFSIKEKRILWLQDVVGNIKDKNFEGGGISYNNEKLFVTNGSRFLIILDAKTGHELKRKEFADVIRTKPILLSEQEVLIQTLSNQIFNYNFANASMIWQHEGVAETLISSKHINPIIHDDKVLISYTSGQLFALDSKTGQELWSVNLSSSQDLSLPNFDPSSMPCSPMIDGNNIYVATSNNKLVKLSVSTGQTIWQVDASDIQSMSLNGNSLFTTNNAKQVVAFSTDDGKIKWLSDLDMKKDKHQTKAASFLSPLVLQNAAGWELSVVNNMGEIYSFAGIENNLSTTPNIIKIIKSVQYSGVTCCGNIYLIGDKYAMIFEQENENKK